MTIVAVSISAALVAQTPSKAVISGPVGPSPYDIVRGWHKPFAAAGLRLWRQLRRLRGIAEPHLRRAARRNPAARSDSRRPSPDSRARSASTCSTPPIAASGRTVSTRSTATATSRSAGRSGIPSARARTGPGPHRIRISPYDPEHRVWVVNETFSQIYVFSNDGSKLLKTLGEKNVPGQGRDALRQAAGRGVSAGRPDSHRGRPGQSPRDDSRPRHELPRRVRQLRHRPRAVQRRPRRRGRPARPDLRASIDPATASTSSGRRPIPRRSSSSRRGPASSCRSTSSSTTTACG